RRQPLARALRAARHPADGRGSCAHPGHLPGGRRRPAVGRGAREDHRDRIVHRGQAFLWAERRRGRAHAAGKLRPCGRRSRCARGTQARRGRLEVTRLTVLPHETLCPEGAEIEGKPGASICDTLLENHIEIEHACEKSCACTTCHVIVREGYESLDPPTEKE